MMAAEEQAVMVIFHFPLFTIDTVIHHTHEPMKAGPFADNGIENEVPDEVREACIQAGIEKILADDDEHLTERFLRAADIQLQYAIEL